METMPFPSAGSSYRTGCLPDLADYIAIQRANDRFAAKYRCGIWNADRCIDIRPFSLIARFRRHGDFQEEVARFAAICARHALPFQPDGLARVDPGRNMHLKRLYPAGPPEGS